MTTHMEAVKKCRVLIAEDNPDQRRMLQTWLMGRPFKVDFSNTGELTLALWHAAHREGLDYELIICDIAMPMKTGITVMKELAEQGNRSPVILVTALQPRKVEELLFNCAPVRPYDVLFKPDAYVEILPVITRALSQQGCAMDWKSELADLRMPESFVSEMYLNDSEIARSVGMSP